MARRKKPRSEGSASAVDHASDSEEAAELTRKTRGGKGAKAGKAALKTAASKGVSTSLCLCVKLLSLLGVSASL